MSDFFSQRTPGLNDPASHAFPVTPNNGQDLPVSARFVYVGVSGDLVCDTVGGSAAVLFKNVPVGVLPVRVTRVYATGTTATDIVAAY